ncbi:MAG: DUF3106 domain-containing protein [Burkholderiales bacterium]|nr:DUF3106 domain-containing protein [Burkholderiales bacterium]
MTVRPGVGFGTILAALLVMGSTFLGTSVKAAGSPPSARSGAHVAVTAASASAAASWSTLSAAQRRALQPLAALWPSMESNSKERWITVANRFDGLSPAEQRRMQERMTQWSRLPSQQRGEARLRFQQTRELPPQERQEKWAAYQALSPQARGDLIQQARRKKKPVFLPDGMAGPREQAQQMATKRKRDANSANHKSNLVPNPQRNAPGQVVVSPSLINAGRGATTTLISQRPTPPLHQHTGLPKISATKTFVDPDTMLPRRGAQGAAVTTPAASQTP